MMEETKVKTSSVILIIVISTVVSWLLPLLLGKYSDLTYHRIALEHQTHELITISDLYKDAKLKQPSAGGKEKKLPECPAQPSELQGLQFLPPDIERLQVEDDELWAEKLSHAWHIKRGGLWQPSHCKPRYAVSVIVCVRDRQAQLEAFLRHMHPFLSRQLLHYRIVVVEQNNSLAFNRAKLFNIGYKEAIKAGRDGAEALCLVFHDVDLLPLNDFNTYTCTWSPRHMSVAVDSLRYELPYRSLCGGAMAITAQQFKRVNGFSNAFEGWGAEDDDFCNRLHDQGLSVVRFSPEVSTYTMLPHAPATAAPKLFTTLGSRDPSGRDDGLSSLTYTIVATDHHPLMLLVTVTW